MYSIHEHPASEQLRSVLRFFGWTVLYMGIYTLLSGGVNVFSSCLAIALGQQWLEATSLRRASLKSDLDEQQLLRDQDCCTGQCRGVFDNIKGLAYAVITFGVLEMLLLVPILWMSGSGMGSACLENLYDALSSSSFSSGTPTADPKPGQGGNSYPTSTTNVFDEMCSSDLSTGQWLYYALGHNTLAAPLNIAWGALTLNFLTALTTRHASSDESTSLLARG